MPESADGGVSQRSDPDQEARRSFRESGRRFLHSRFPRQGTQRILGPCAPPRAAALHLNRASRSARRCTLNPHPTSHIPAEPGTKTHPVIASLPEQDRSGDRRTHAYCHSWSVHDTALAFAPGGQQVSPTYAGDAARAKERLPCGA